jgi:hypothetical protein
MVLKKHVFRYIDNKSVATLCTPRVLVLGVCTSRPSRIFIELVIPTMIIYEVHY